MAFFDHDLVTTLRARIDAMPACAAGWRSFLARMNDHTPRSLAARKRQIDGWRARSPRGLTFMNAVRMAARDAASLAFAHRIGNGGGAHREAAIELLSWALEVPEWRCQGFKNGWKSDLWTADIAAAAGTALDLLGADADAGWRADCAAAILERGVGPVFREWLEPATRIHALDSMGHNWWAVCVGGAAIGLFAASDLDPRAPQRLALAADGLVEFFGYPGNVLQNKHRTFGAAGDFIESAGYLDYTLEPLVFLFELYRRTGGRDLPADIPVLRAVCDYYAALVQPLRQGIRRINFGDMGSGSDSVGSWAHNPAPAWLWLAREYGRSDLAFLARRVRPEPGDILSFLFWPDARGPGSFEGAPVDRVFADIGVAVLRDGYSEDATVLAIKTGETWNHNQADAGTFILSSCGVEFFIDPGTTGYSDPLHAGYFKRGFAHNVVLHDGRDQHADLDHLGTRSMGRIAGTLFAPGYRYVLADATGPWEGVYRRFYRHFLWFDHWLVLLDDLMAWHAGSWTSLYHHAGEARVGENGFVIEHQGETLEAHLIDPVPERIDFGLGYLSRQKQSPQKYEHEITERPYLRVHYPHSGPRAKLLTVFALPGHGMTQGEIAPIRGPGLSGVRLTGAEGSTEILCNHGADGSVMHLNAEIRHGGVRTDAFLSVVERDAAGALKGIGIHNGSRIHCDGTLLLGSLLKGDFLARTAAGGSLHASLGAPATVTLGPPFAAGSQLAVRCPGGSTAIAIHP
jgi:hypothetical protein